jgi:hypothetical protein
MSRVREVGKAPRVVGLLQRGKEVSQGKAGRWHHAVGRWRHTPLAVGATRRWRHTPLAVGATRRWRHTPLAPYAVTPLARVGGRT